MCTYIPSNIFYFLYHIKGSAMRLFMVYDVDKFESHTFSHIYLHIYWPFFQGPALTNEVVDVIKALHGQLAQVLYIGAQQRVLTHSQCRLVAGVQQVTHALTVDLKV